MIDPKTLKAGDVIVFGGKVEQKVKYLESHCFAGTRVRLDDCSAIDGENPLWQIAELKKKELPTLRFQKGVYTPDTSRLNCYFPISALLEAREIVRLLEEAGVEA